MPPLAETFIALSALKRSKESGDKDRRQSVTPYIHPCDVGLNSKIYSADQYYITQKLFSLMNDPQSDLAIF